MTSYNGNPSKGNVLGFIQFLIADRRQLMEIYTRMKAVYSDYSYSHMAVIEWYNKFQQVRESTTDLRVRQMETS